jgi:hypothetical protein
MTTIATSAAQNDGGVFEFGFRDERYMPFEGAGAISRWELSLPTTVRVFDYQTISDVVLRISYTALADATLRTAVDAAAGSVVAYLRSEGVPRVFSLKHDFPDAWAKLANSAPGTDVEVDVTAQRLPFFLSGITLANAPVDVLLHTPAGIAVATPPQIRFNQTDLGVPAKPFARDGDTGLLSATAANGSVLRKHTIRVVDVGSLGRAGTGTGVSAGLDMTKLRDVLLRVVLKKA